MNIKILNAVDHLNKILPLVARQKKLNTEDKNVYQKILSSYVELGRTLNKNEMALLVKNIDETIKLLRANDMVVFDENDEPIGAYPFTMEQREHKIIINGHQVHAMCALDALAVSPMFNMNAQIESRCHVTGDKVFISQLIQEKVSIENNPNVYFGINWNSADNNCCATSLCTEMIFLIDKKTAEAWFSEDKKNREIFTLDEAIEFASLFFGPLVNAA